MLKIMMLDMKEMKRKMSTKVDIEQMANNEDVKLLEARIEYARAGAETTSATRQAGNIRVLLWPCSVCWVFHITSANANVAYMISGFAFNDGA